MRTNDFLRKFIWWFVAAAFPILVLSAIEVVPMAHAQAVTQHYCAYQCQRVDGTTYTPNTPTGNTCNTDADCASKCNQTCRGNGDTCAPSPQPNCTTAGGGASNVQAQGGISGGYGLYDPLGNRSIPLIINAVVRFALGFSGALFLLYFIYGGFLWLTASGETDRIKKAQSALRNAILGMAVIVFSYALITLILGLAGQVNG